MKKLWIYFLGSLENARGAWMIAPLPIGFILLFVAAAKVSPVTDFVDPKDTLSFWLLELSMILFGIQGIIFAKYKEIPFFAQYWAGGWIAVIVGSIFTVLSWGLAIMGFINSFQAR